MPEHVAELLQQERYSGIAGTVHEQLVAEMLCVVVAAQNPSQRQEECPQSRCRQRPWDFMAASVVYNHIWEDIT
jgi:hypothetical protein